MLNKILIFLKWIIIIFIISIISSISAAIFLKSLEYVTNFRENNFIIFYFLPIAGFFVGLLYFYLGKDLEGGNNLIIANLQGENKKFNWLASPFIYISTVITHLFGGSAGREGTALQMSSAFTDIINKKLKLNEEEKHILILMSVASGFASVFGTPIAGFVFALEFFIIGKINYKGILPTLLTAVLSNYLTLMIGIKHGVYNIINVTNINISGIIYSILAGVFFGLIAFVFSFLLNKISSFLKIKIKYSPLKPLIGGVIVIILFLIFKNSSYLGLSLDLLSKTFISKVNNYDFILKLLFTIITLSFGYKGGEVTPLFVIGACAGNFLSLFLPLSFSLLSGMGMVAVFAGATNTPFACIIMGIELFGSEGIIYIAIACIVSYIISGHSSIYIQQKIGVEKTFLKKTELNTYIKDIKYKYF